MIPRQFLKKNSFLKNCHSSWGYHDSPSHTQSPLWPRRSRRFGKDLAFDEKKGPALRKVYEDLGIWKMVTLMGSGDHNFVWRLCRTTLFGRCWTHAHHCTSTFQLAKTITASGWCSFRAWRIAVLQGLYCLIPGSQISPSKPRKPKPSGQAGGFTGTAGAFHFGGAGDHRQWSGCSHRWQGAVQHAAAVQGWCVCFLLKEKRPLKLRLGRWCFCWKCLEMVNFGVECGILILRVYGWRFHHPFGLVSSFCLTRSCIDRMEFTTLVI